MENEVIKERMETEESKMSAGGHVHRTKLLSDASLLVLLMKRERRHCKERVTGGQAVRWLLSVLVLSAILLQGAVWSIVEAESSQPNFSNETAVRQWMTDKLGVREGMFVFRYEGETAKLTQLLTRAIQQAVYSDPFIRYNVSRYSIQWKGTTEEAVVNIYVDYRETYEEYQFVRQEAKRIVNEQMPGELNETATVRWIHDYLITRLAYDVEMETFTAYEALQIGVTVCQGYALLMQAMLEEAGIPSIVVEGEAGGTLHAWNMVQVEGQWYHVDTTWNDPVPDRQGTVRYTYFMLSDEEMQRDHQWDVLKTPRADQSWTVR